ncbi:MAG: SDR family NAD(P)-dependent oxidoreductase [Pelagibacteraceae bacterium]
MNKENLVVIIGGTGAIGNAIAIEIGKLGFKEILKIGTKTNPSIDFNDESTIIKTAEFIKKKNKPISILFDATGILHHENSMPEKTLKSIDIDFAKKNFLINSIGPALLIKHFAALLDSENKSVFATLSAKVGSISDNGYGGWYSYRASKAALNQLIKTASIEMKIKNKKAVFLALHPGTVKSNLSQPFQKANLKIQEPEESAKHLVKILDSVDQSQTGKFFNWDGSELPW